MSIYEIIVQVFLGVVLADIASGFVHWFEDTYGNPKWPIIGKWVIEPNIVHHEDPLRFTKGPFLRRNQAVFGIALVFAGLFALTDSLNVLTVTFLIAGSYANEAHRWAHLPTHAVPKAIRALQHVGLLQSAQHHWAHHRKGFNTHYCSLTNMMNPFLDGLHVFRLIEGVLEGLFRIKPRYDREAYQHPTLGRRWIAPTRRLACAAAFHARVRLNAVLTWPHRCFGLNSFA